MTFLNCAGPHPRGATHKTPERGARPPRCDAQNTERGASRPDATRGRTYLTERVQVGRQVAWLGVEVFYGFDRSRPESSPGDRVWFADLRVSETAELSRGDLSGSLRASGPRHRAIPLTRRSAA